MLLMLSRLPLLLIVVIAATVVYVRLWCDGYDGNTVVGAVAVFVVGCYLMHMMATLLLMVLLFSCMVVFVGCGCDVVLMLLVCQGVFDVYKL